MKWEDIKVSRRTSGKKYFESTFLQSISDRIEFLKDEADDLLGELDSCELKQRYDELDLEEFSEDAIDQIEDVVSDISQFKYEIIDAEEVPDFIKDTSKNVKIALDRDQDYIRRAKRKFKRLESKEDLVDTYKINIRIIELCNKAIDVDEFNPEPYLLKGRALGNIEKYDEAVDEFINCLALDENNLDARLAIADINRLTGEYDDAIDVYDSVLKIDDDSFEAFRGKALTYFNMEKYIDADTFFKKADSISVLDYEDNEIWKKCKYNLKRKV